MNIGLGNLRELKEFVLAESVRQGSDFDTALSAIGLGVAASFDRYCNRTFARGEGVTETTSAARDHYYVRRYPIESVTAFEKLTDDAAGWESLTVGDEISNTVNEIGRLYFGFEHGPWYEQIRITYTGGYWFDTSEDETETLPSGATQLPSDIKLAWLMQCQHAFNQRDRLGSSIGQKAEVTSAMSTYELIPEIQSMLNQRIRYALS